MLLTFKIILLIVLSISGFGSIGEEDKNKRSHFLKEFVASAILLIITFILVP